MPTLTGEPSSKEKKPQDKRSVQKSYGMCYLFTSQECTPSHEESILDSDTNVFIGNNSDF